jgi:hypothetical protein
MAALRIYRPPNPGIELTMPARYRILSLDGGGSWALIEVKALIELYSAETRGHDVLREFDLVAATSGGSLVLAGLVEDLRLDQILGFFKDEDTRKVIFSPTDFVPYLALHALTGAGPKYSARNKLSALSKLLPGTGDLPLARAVDGIRRNGSCDDLHILITSFDYDRNRAKFFRSARVSGPQWGIGEAAHVTLAEAIHASSNAPVNFFDAPATFPDRPGRFWDGAIAGCTNPVLAGVTEAIVRTHGHGDLAVLSIGTGHVALPWPRPGEESSPFVAKRSQPGFKTDLEKLSGSIIDDPPDIATFLAHVMTGSAPPPGVHPPADSRIVRMNPLISPLRTDGELEAPGDLTEEDFTDLVNLGIDAMEQSDVDAISEYADLWLKNAAPSQPIRMNADTLKRELGQSTFEAASAAWEAIK